MSGPYSNLSATEAVDQLRHLRDSKIRDSEQVISLFNVLRQKTGGFSSSRYMHKPERLVVLEQVAIAGLDCHDQEVASICIRKLLKEFPERKPATEPGSRDGRSFRVHHLIGLQFESKKNYEEATALYEDLLRERPTDTFSTKRIAAIQRAKGDFTGAIRTLNSYLSNFPADYESWAELAELYSMKLEFTFALHCYEEQLIGEPYNYLLHCRIAETHYNLAMASNSSTAVSHLELARNFFCHTLKLKPNCLRAQMCLSLVCSRLANMSSIRSQDHLSLGDSTVEKLMLSVEKTPHAQPLSSAMDKLFEK